MGARDCAGCPDRADRNQFGDLERFVGRRAHGQRPAGRVTVVSMSWGISESGAISPAQQRQFDQALSGFTGISYVSATGDSGGAGLYPSTSPSVLAVGSTFDLKLTTDGSYNTMTAWSGSGWQVPARSESKPTYQDGVLQIQLELQRSVCPTWLSVAARSPPS